MLNETTIRRLLLPFGLDLATEQISQLNAYLELLMRWNARINLTAIRDPEACVTRHFGETLFLGRWAELKGMLLDIGSGAGFPGLSLKIIFPDLSVTLLEPIAKKRAFLKEAARECGMNSVEVRGERLDDFAKIESRPAFDAATARAVGQLEDLIPLASHCLKPGGDLFLWLSHQQGVALPDNPGEIKKVLTIDFPEGYQGEIWCGRKDPEGTSI
jgi:16S rRNA (guanine527-N7)-methyltransferase